MFVVDTDDTKGFFENTHIEYSLFIIEHFYSEG